MIDHQALAERLSALAEAQHIAGYTACILGPEGPIFELARGVRDDKGTPTNMDTMFGIGSLSKSMTALCVCILAVEGKLGIDDLVTHWVPRFRMTNGQETGVTLRHLLTHTSGLPPMEPLEWSSAMNTQGRQAGEDVLALQKTAPNAIDCIAQVLDYIAVCPHRPVGAPGETFSYSNEGYAILSYVVDAAAGMPLERYMQERVFTPLGMTRTILDNGIDDARALSGGNITSLFTWEDEQQVIDDGWSILPPYRGCAMVKSTARDLAAYYRAIANYGLHEGKQAFPREAVELMIGAAYPAGPEPFMCMGLNKRSHAGHVIVDHGGALHGVSAKGALLPAEGYGFAIATNESDVGLDRMMWTMENAVLGLSLDESHEWFIPTGKDYPTPERIAGRYAACEGFWSRLTVADDGRHAERDGEALTLVDCGNDRFCARDKDGGLSSRLTFHIKDGKAWGVSVGTRVFMLEEAKA